MIIVSWYNFVAIVIAVFWVNQLFSLEKSDTFGLESMLLFLLGIIFFAIWGGIFWW